MLSVSLVTAGLAGAAGALSIAAYFLERSKSSLSLVGYAFVTLAAAVGTLLYGSGGLSSPYIALWIFIGLAAGLFGALGLASVAVLAHGYLGYLLVTGEPVTASTVLTFIFAVEVPLIVSYFLWYEKKEPWKAESNYSALVRELGQVANKSEIVINAIADGVIVIDEKGIIQLINPAAQAIVGWGKQDADGLDYRSVMKLIDQQGKEVDDSNDPVQQSLKTHESVVTENLSLQTASGKTLILSLLVSPVGKADSNNGAILVFRDITALRSEERQQAEFISTASHEMRTPVASIEGYLGLALNPQTAQIDDKARAYLTKAHEAAQHLGRLFQDLLDISKAEDGRLKNEPTVVDVVHFVREMTESFGPKARDKGLQLTYAPDANPEQASASSRLTPAFYAYVDADHFREVTSNLIENAIKYTKQGSVTVDVQGDEEQVRVTINDTGIGIPAEDIPHLFQKFYRVDNTDTREIGGTGLGLYLSRRLVESMGGHLTLDSEYGKGSTFTIAVPRLAHEDAMRKIELASQDPQP